MAIVCDIGVVVVLKADLRTLPPPALLIAFSFFNAEFAETAGKFKYQKSRSRITNQHSKSLQIETILMDLICDVSVICDAPTS